MLEESEDYGKRYRTAQTVVLKGWTWMGEVDVREGGAKVRSLILVPSPIRITVSVLGTSRVPAIKKDSLASPCY